MWVYFLLKLKNEIGVFLERNLNAFFILTGIKIIKEAIKRERKSN